MKNTRRSGCRLRLDCGSTVGRSAAACCRNYLIAIGLMIAWTAPVSREAPSVNSTS